MVCVFFDLTSRMTNFILFNNFVFIPLYVIATLLVAKHHLEINDFFLGIKREGVLNFRELYKANISSSLNYLFISLSTFTEIVFTNTFLCMTDTVNTYMKTKYGENIMADRGYNSSSKSVLKNLGALTSITLTYSATLLADVANVARQADATIQVAKLSTEASRVTAEATVEAAKFTADAAIKSSETQLEMARIAAETAKTNAETAKIAFETRH